jgi:hypothetical protein
MVARVLRELVRPVRDDLRQPRAVVIERPALSRWLLRLSLRRKSPPPGGQRWSDWLDWLGPGEVDAPAWLRRYAVLEVPPAVSVALPVDHPAVPPGDEAGQADLAEDRALIAAFVLRSHSFDALEGRWWPALLAIAREPPDEEGAGSPARADLADLLRSASAGGPDRDLSTAVRLDTLRLCLGLPCRHYPVTGTAMACLAYLDALWNLWLAEDTDVDIQALTIRLLVLPTGADPLGEAAIALLKSVVSDDRVPFTGPVADVIAGLIDAVPELAADPRLPADWWARVARYRSEIRTPADRLRAEVRRARTNPEAADPVDIAVLCGRAAADAMPAADLLAVVGDYLASRSQPERAAMFAIVQSVLLLADTSQASSQEQAALGELEQRAAGPQPRTETVRHLRLS